jgi:hypothetical protein
VNNEKSNLLTVATDHGQDRIIKILLTHYNVKLSHNNYESLLLAVNNNSVEGVCYLLTYYQEYLSCNERRVPLAKALIIASTNKFTQMCELLLENDAEVSYKDHEAFFIAIENNSAEILELFLINYYTRNGGYIIKETEEKKNEEKREEKKEEEDEEKRENEEDFKMNSPLLDNITIDSSLKEVNSIFLQNNIDMINCIKSYRGNPNLNEIVNIAFEIARIQEKEELCLLLKKYQGIPKFDVYNHVTSRELIYEVIDRIPKTLPSLFSKMLRIKNESKIDFFKEDGHIKDYEERWVTKIMVLNRNKGELLIYCFYAVTLIRFFMKSRLYANPINNSIFLPSDIDKIYISANLDPRILSGDKYYTDVSNHLQYRFEGHTMYNLPYNNFIYNIPKTNELNE